MKKLTVFLLTFIATNPSIHSYAGNVEEKISTLQQACYQTVDMKDYIVTAKRAQIDSKLIACDERVLMDILSEYYDPSELEDKKARAKSLLSLASSVFSDLYYDSKVCEGSCGTINHANIATAHRELVQLLLSHVQQSVGNSP